MSEAKDVELLPCEERVKRMAAVIVSCNLSENETELADYLRTNITRIVQVDRDSRTPSPSTEERAREATDRIMVAFQDVDIDALPERSKILSIITNAFATTPTTEVDTGVWNTLVSAELALVGATAEHQKIDWRQNCELALRALRKQKERVRLAQPEQKLKVDKDANSEWLMGLRRKHGQLGSPIPLPHNMHWEIVERLTAVERERDELRGQDEVSKALAELRVATAMDRVEVLCHRNNGFKIAGMRDGNRLIDTGWHDSFEAAMQNVRVWNPMESSK